MVARMMMPMATMDARFTWFFRIMPQKRLLQLITVSYFTGMVNKIASAEISSG